MDRLIFGCGYLGSRVAEHWRSAGDRVTIVTRCAQRAEEFTTAGYESLVADVTQPATLADCANRMQADTVLYAVGYDRRAASSINEVYAQGVQNVFAALIHSPERMIYISTTGVYGPAGGQWVDETTLTNPLRDGGRASLAAEENLQSSRFAQQGVVLRLAGLYGPGRVPFLKVLKSGEPIAAPQQGWLNLIHADDAARGVLAAADIENVSQLYCVSDGAPVIRGDYYREAARLVGAPTPTFVAPPADSPRASRAAADKRVGNQRMLSELGVRLSYPSYREGLSSILGNNHPSG